MAWNSDPTIRDLARYCDEHEYFLGVFFGIRSDGKIGIITYGKTKKLCAIAKDLGDQTWAAIEAGQIAPRTDDD
ncbi:MAG TPA: hypothetical protein VNA25_00285 [Phycisphaerae bacterium]|nr:hypothetical protein [Phycisphaerae bacterium]